MAHVPVPDTGRDQSQKGAGLTTATPLPGVLTGRGPRRKAALHIRAAGNADVTVLAQGVAE